MSSTLDLATAYRNAGLSVIPLRLDGSKAAAVPSWNPYRERLATDDELDKWFRHPHGIGIPCGRISGGLEGIDFDAAELFAPFCSLIDPATYRKLTIVETPGGGGFGTARGDD